VGYERRSTRHGLQITEASLQQWFCDKGHWTQGQKGEEASCGQELRNYEHFLTVMANTLTTRYIFGPVPQPDKRGEGVSKDLDKDFI